MTNDGTPPTGKSGGHKIGVNPDGARKAVTNAKAAIDKLNDVGKQIKAKATVLHDAAGDPGTTGPVKPDAQTADTDGDNTSKDLAKKAEAKVEASVQAIETVTDVDEESVAKITGSLGNLDSSLLDQASRIFSV